MTDPLPQNIYEELKRVLAEYRNGSFTLHFTGGSIHKLEVQYVLKADDGRNGA